MATDLTIFRTKWKFVYADCFCSGQTFSTYWYSCSQQRETHKLINFCFSCCLGKEEKSLFMDVIFIFSWEALDSSWTKHIIRKTGWQGQKTVKFHHDFRTSFLKMQEDCSNNISTTHFILLEQLCKSERRQHCCNLPQVKASVGLSTAARGLLIGPAAEQLLPKQQKRT